MKKICIKLGGVIATLLMFSPIYVIHNYNAISNPFFWLICTILYDIYMYCIIEKQEYINRMKEHYYKYIKNGPQLLDLEISDKEHLKSTNEFIENVFKNISE